MTYHYNTNNISFLKMAKHLKDKGIKNWNFMLSLHDPKLKNVNPYDKNLTLEMTARVMREVELNYWYFIREVIKIPSTGGEVDYELHRGNMAVHWLQLQNINTLEVLPRQHYKTWSACCWYTWIYMYKARNYTIVFSNKQLEDSQQNLTRLMDIVGSLPEYLRSHMNKKLDTDNVNMLKLAEHNNTIKALSTGRDEKSADKLGKKLLT